MSNDINSHRHGYEIEWHKKELFLLTFLWYLQENVSEQQLTFSVYNQLFRQHICKLLGMSIQSLPGNYRPVHLTPPLKQNIFQLEISFYQRLSQYEISIQTIQSYLTFLPLYQVYKKHISKFLMLILYNRQFDLFYVLCRWHCDICDNSTTSKRLRTIPLNINHDTHGLNHRIKGVFPSLAK